MAHLVEREQRDDGLENAVRRALQQVRGLFALVLAAAGDPDKIVAVRNGPPLVVGMGRGEYFLASDIPAVAGHTPDVVHLGDREMAVITRARVEFTDFAGKAVSKATQRIQWDPVTAQKAGYKHFMLKEIFEQPWAASGRRWPGACRKTGEPCCWASSTSPTTGCGPSSRLPCWPAARPGMPPLVGKFLIEQLARLRVDVDYGSEYRYRDPLAGDGTLAVVITQSGETADTLAALREAQARGAATIAICNVAGSMAARLADAARSMHARRPRGRRRLDEGVHLAARHPGPAGAAPGARPRHDRRGLRAAARRGPDAAPGADPARARVRRRRRRDRETVLPAHRTSCTWGAA